MELKDIKDRIPEDIFKVIESEGITALRPSQEKAIEAGLLKNENLVICTPTASGKTLIAELAATKTIIEDKRKAIYIVPLVALASEKNKDFKRKYGHLFKIALSVGDMDSSDPYLVDYDFIICTAEELDSLMRHKAPWLKYVKCVVVDEIHLLNSVSRGPTLEIILTILKSTLKDVQLIGLSATIGNPYELAEWLNAKLVIDKWRPVELKKGIYHENKIEFENKEIKK